MLKLSHSSLSMYKDCPFKWKLRYIDRVPERPKHYFSFGNAIHAALETMYGGEVCATLEAVIDSFLTEWSDAGYKDAKAIAKAQRDGQAMLREFHAEFAPQWVKPLMVETEFTFAIDHVPVRGYIDRVDILPDGTLHVLDYKTGRDIEPGRIDEDEQLTIYQIAAEHLFPESKVGKVSLLHVPSRTWHSAPTRTPAQVQALRTHVLATAEAITAKQFYCRPSEPSCQWCDYKALCPHWRP